MNRGTPINGGTESSTSGTENLYAAGMSDEDRERAGQFLLSRGWDLVDRITRAWQRSTWPACRADPNRLRVSFIEVGVPVLPLWSLR